MKQMKRLLSLVLCLSMVISLLPVFAADTDVDDDNTSSMETLEMLGFSIDAGAFNRSALKPGTHPVESQHELVATTYRSGHIIPEANYFYEYEKEYFDIKDKTQHFLELVWDIGRRFTRKLADTSYFMNYIDPSPYFMTSSFDPDCRGMKSYTAKVSLDEWGTMALHVYPTNFENESERVTHVLPGIQLNSERPVKMWLCEGLASIDTGDFDGDGREEIAVYVPDNGGELTSSMSNKLDIKIFSFDPATETITEKQSLDLTYMGDISDTCPWNHSYYNGNKEYFNIPYVSLCADDVNGDGIDDLLATMNFSTEFNGVSSTKGYTTAQALDPTSCWASLLEVYEGTEGGELVNTVLHKPLIANGTGEKPARYVIRHANAIVADVTAEGSKEIVIGGRYTKIKYKDSNVTGSTIVNTTREVRRGDCNVFANILGFASYDSIKSYNTYDDGAPYIWVQKDAETTTLYHYNFSMNNPIQQPVSLCGYKFDGFGHPDRLFIEGQTFQFDSDENKLAFVEEVYLEELESSYYYTNRWYGKAVAANCGDATFGTEILAVPYYQKRNGDVWGEWFETYMLTIQPVRQHHREWKSRGFTSEGWENDIPADVERMETVSQVDYEAIFPSAETEAITRCHLSLSWGDFDDDSTFITYENGDTDVYFSKVEPLAIMQAPPLYEELNDDTYLGNSATGFAKSSGSGEGSSHGGSLTAGAVMGFEQETSFLGLFTVAGGSVEAKITASISKEKSNTTTFDYSSGFETAGTTDAVVIFTVPYVRYNCTMTVPEYQVPSEEEYNHMRDFRDELKANLEAYADTNVKQIEGVYSWGLPEFDYMYHSQVTEDNYGDQLGVYDAVAKEVEAIENSVAVFEKGGDKEWGEVVGKVTLPYHYCLPQSPMVTTVSVATHDAMAEYIGTDKIYEKVFNNGYVAGDPNTYAHSIADLKKTSDKVLEGKNNLSDSGDGFLTNSNLSAPGTIQSQTISVEKEDSDTLGWGAAVEGTILVKLGGGFGGATACVEETGSKVTTTTEGNEYSGAVVALPEGTTGDYSYNWKLVSYSSKLNGKKVPVVGYLTKVNATPPPSIAQSISVEEVTDSSATISWEDGNRAADYYRLSRVFVVNGNEQMLTVLDDIKAVDGKCTATITNLNSSASSTYVIESFSDRGSKSVPTDKFTVTTFPKGFDVDFSISGADSNVVYRSGKTINLTSAISGNEGYDTFYQWQVDNGDGWKDIKGKNTANYSFDISPIDDETRIRCIAYIMVSDTSSCIAYSSPLTLNCSKTDGNYAVEWGEDEVTVTFDEGTENGMVVLFVEDANGVGFDYKSAASDDYTFDLSDIDGEDSKVKLFIWDKNLKPMGYVFER